MQEWQVFGSYGSFSQLNLDRLYKYFILGLFVCVREREKKEKDFNDRIIMKNLDAYINVIWHNLNI